MPWSTTRTPGTQAKYRTAAHRRERARLIAQLKRTGHAVCAQPVCVMHSRDIYPGDQVHLGHDDSGERYIGLVHMLCNVKDGARRGNARSRGMTSRRSWVL